MPLWVRFIEGGTGFAFDATSLAVGSSGEIALTGGPGSATRVDFRAPGVPGSRIDRSFVAVLGPDGSLRWSRSLEDGVREQTRAALDEGGNVVLVGTVNGSVPAAMDDGDGFVARFER